MSEIKAKNYTGCTLVNALEPCEIKTVLDESKQEIITPEIIDYSLGYAAGRNDLRDHFAGLAMQGIIDSLDIDFREVAEDAYAYADAMLVERDKCKNGLSEGL